MVNNSGLSKVPKLLIQMAFYGLLFYIVAVSLGWVSFSIIGMVRALFPILFGLKWFIKVFIILYLLIPFINYGLVQLDKKEYQVFLIIMLFFFSFYPSFLPSPPVTDNGYGIITFVLMYALGGYLRKFYNAGRSKCFHFNIYIILVIIIFLFSIAFPDKIHRIWGYNFIFNVFASLFLFLFFSKLDFKSKFINYFATFTLGVYFIHTDPSIHNFLYQSLLKTGRYWHSSFFVIHFVISIISVYIICTMIDICRAWIFDRLSKYVVPFFNRHFPFLWRQIP